MQLRASVRVGFSSNYTMRTPLAWGGLLLALSLPLLAQFESTKLNIPTNAVIRLEFAKTEFLIGENAFANYVISNTGGPVIKPNTGGDYRGGTRANRFKITAVRSDGYEAPDPEPFQWRMGGFMGGRDVAAGSNWFEHVRLPRYREITQPGEYTITVFHDLGWGPRQSNDIREVSAKLRFRLPTADEARGFVRETLNAPAHGGYTWGERGQQRPGITALSHPVYLPELIEQAENGSSAALAGINSVRTVEGTEALVRMMRASAGGEVPTNALVAARYLERRLPKAPPRPEWETDEQAAQRKRLQATWHPRFAEPVRQFALALLRTTNREALTLAASELSVTGRAEDYKALLPVVERAAQLTDTEWRADHGYPEPLSVAKALAGTAFQLGRTHQTFDSARTSGQALLFLNQLQQTNIARPRNWERTVLRLLEHPSGFIRAQTIAAIPRHHSKAISNRVAALMMDRDVTVQNRAFLACSGLRSPTARFAALHALTNTTSRWLLPEAVSFALTNGARVEAAEILARRFNDRLDGPGSNMRHEAFMSLVKIVSGSGHVSGGFGAENEKSEPMRMQREWTEFIARHRAELAAGRAFKPGDGSSFGDLILPGWQFYSRQ